MVDIGLLKGPFVPGDKALALVMCRYLVRFRVDHRCYFEHVIGPTLRILKTPQSSGGRHFNPVHWRVQPGILREEVMLEIFPKHTVIEFAMNGAIPPVFKGYALEK